MRMRTRIQKEKSSDLNVFGVTPSVPIYRVHCNTTVFLITYPGVATERPAQGVRGHPSLAPRVSLMLLAPRVMLPCP